MTAPTTPAIHPTALVSPGARLGHGVVIGPFTIVHPGVVLDDGVRVQSHAVIGDEDGSAPTVIGAGSTIRSGSVVCRDVVLGPGCHTGHHVLVREGCRLGRSVSVGSGSDLEGDLTIGDHTRLHSAVHVSTRTAIGRFVWVFPGVIFTNDPLPPSATLQGATVGDHAVVATGSIVFPGVRIGARAVVGAGSLVRRDVPDDALASGAPARVLGPAHRLRVRATGEAAYPWMPRFSRGMPWADVGYDAWLAAHPDEGPGT